MAKLTVFFTDFEKSWTQEIDSYAKIQTDSKLGTIVITDLSPGEIPSDASNSENFFRSRSFSIVYDMTADSSAVSNGSKTINLSENTFYIELSAKRIVIRY